MGFPDTNVIWCLILTSILSIGVSLLYTVFNFGWYRLQLWMIHQKDIPKPVTPLPIVEKGLILVIEIDGDVDSIGDFGDDKSW